MDDLDLGSTVKGFIPGQNVFGRYTLTRLLGRGGMGVVWLARDDKLERDVALKFLPEVMMGDKVALGDLKRETRRSLELTHPHIVRIYDFVDDARTAGIAMEYIAGDTLGNARADKPGRCFEVAELSAWVGQLCSALEHAHTKAKVVHRDLKPANLMVDAKGDLKVTDFGIASSIADSVSRVSKQAGTSGTPVYMSPQQMMGEKPAVTDDIYALGATLYDLLTGKPPFFSGNILMQVQNKVPPTLAARRAELGHTGAPIPAEWEATIAACLAKDSAERPQSAGEVAQLLGLGGSPQRGAGDAKQEAPKVARVDPNAPAAAADNGLGSSRSTSKTPLYVGLAAVGVVLAVMGWLELVHAPEQRRLEAEARRAQERQIEAEGENSAAVAASRPIMIRDLGLEMLPISPGRFAMGSASGGLDHERPVTQVTISRPFWLGKTEVTQAQWEALMGSDPSNFKGANLPVEQVTWDEAMAFCQKLTERERAAGRLPEGYAYTLPTETQWEYACRAGTTGDYAGHLDTMGWYDANSGNSTNPVGQKQANAWGLHDMHGNVWEWCLDWYGNYPGGSVTDPSGPGSGSHRVIRGGSWLPFAVNCRSAFRFMITPDIRENSLGFRVALTPARTSPART